MTYFCTKIIGNVIETEKINWKAIHHVSQSIYVTFLEEKKYILFAWWKIHIKYYTFKGGT